MAASVAGRLLLTSYWCLMPIVFPNQELYTGCVLACYTNFTTRPEDGTYAGYAVRAIVWNRANAVPEYLEFNQSTECIYTKCQADADSNIMAQYTEFCIAMRWLSIALTCTRREIENAQTLQRGSKVRVTSCPEDDDLIGSVLTAYRRTSKGDWIFRTPLKAEYELHSSCYELIVSHPFAFDHRNCQQYLVNIIYDQINRSSTELDSTHVGIMADYMQENYDDYGIPLAAWVSSGSNRNIFDNAINPTYSYLYARGY